MKLSLPLHAIEESPGVYLMKDDQGRVLYIGKAKNLRARLTTYFVRGGDDRAQIPYLLAQVADVETILVSTEKEALLLEERLVRQFRPKYNVLLKDDRSRLHIYIDLHHPFPKISMQRFKEGMKLPQESFGPFSNSHAAHDVFELVVKLFCLRQCSDEEFSRRTRPCLLFQLKKCTAPCVGAISDQEYSKQVTSALTFLRGKTKEIVSLLRTRIEEASASLDFEQAARLLKQLHIVEASESGVSCAVGVRDVDVLALYRSGTTCAFCVMQYRKGLLVFSETLVLEEPDAAELVEMDELIVQYYRKKGSIPPELLVNEKLLYKNALTEVLYEQFGVKVSIHHPKRGKKKELVALAQANASSNLTQKKSSREHVLSLLQELEDRLQLQKTPLRIDCFDVSHMSGRNPVASCISFREGVPYKRGYRLFRIEKDISSDDCSMMREAVLRRYRSASQEDAMPDLVLIDGGVLQLRAAQEALQQSGLIGVDVCSLCKEASRHDRGMTAEKILCLHQKAPVLLERSSSSLHLLQRIRDEAHRFAQTYRKKRESQALVSSQLDRIIGIGPKKKKALFSVFSGIEAIRLASVEEIHQKAGVSLSDALRIKQCLK